MTPLEFGLGMLGLGFIIGGSLGLSLYIRFLQRQGKWQRRIIRLKAEAMDSHSNIHRATYTEKDLEE